MRESRRDAEKNCYFCAWFGGRILLVPFSDGLATRRLLCSVLSLFLETLDDRRILCAGQRKGVEKKRRGRATALSTGSPPPLALLRLPILRNPPLIDNVSTPFAFSLEQKYSLPRTWTLLTTSTDGIERHDASRRKGDPNHVRTFHCRALKLSVIKVEGNPKGRKSIGFGRNPAVFFPRVLAA